MTETPNVWDINEDIPFELFVVDPVTGLGVTGQTAFITLSIKRLSDDLFWNTTVWASGFAGLSVTEPDATNQPGRYTFVLDGPTGNDQEDVYLFRAVVANPSLPNINGENYEQHKSRTSNVVVVEAEPVQ